MALVTSSECVTSITGTHCLSSVSSRGCLVVTLDILADLPGLDGVGSAK